MHRIREAARLRRRSREFNRVLDSASPAMQQELRAAWTRHISN